LIFSAHSAWAQPFTLGLRAGVPLTDFIDTVQTPRFGFNSNTKRYIIGPSAELWLPFSFEVEFDALYHRLNYEGGGTLIDVITSSRTAGNAWEFPLVVKHSFHAPFVRPYVAAGAASEHTEGSSRRLPVQYCLLQYCPRGR